MIVVCIILAAIFTIGGLAVLFSLSRNADKKRKELDEMLEEHKKNKEK